MYFFKQKSIRVDFARRGYSFGTHQCSRGSIIDPSADRIGARIVESSCPVGIPVKGQFGTSIGFRLDSSSLTFAVNCESRASQEDKSPREELYKIAKKKRRLTVTGRARGQ